jgi:rubredoxin-NAD+ reductase
MDPIIVVGSGLAGYSVLRELRRRARERPALMVTADSGEYYSKPSLSNALAQGHDAADLVLNTAAQMGAATGARVLVDTRVLAIDPVRRCIRTSGGELRYSSLVLALGATSRRPDLAGNGAADVLCVNSLHDYIRFREALRGAQKVMLLGGGLIGCEFANDLAVAGVAVDVVEPAPCVLSRFLPAQAAAALQRRLEVAGVCWHLGVAAQRVDRVGRKYELTLDDGSILQGDLVLAAIGLSPQTALARGAGIAVNRGVVVNRYLATSAPNVYALGDCAEVEGLLLPFTTPISHAARALGATLGGKPTKVQYPAMPVSVKTPSWPTVVAPAPLGAEGSWQCVPSHDGMRSLMRDDSGRLLGFALHGVAVDEAGLLARELPALLA